MLQMAHVMVDRHTFKEYIILDGTPPRISRGSSVPDVFFVFLGLPVVFSWHFNYEKLICSGNLLKRSISRAFETIMPHWSRPSPLVALQPYSTFSDFFSFLILLAMYGLMRPQLWKCGLGITKRSQKPKILKLHFVSMFYSLAR